MNIYGLNLETWTNYNYRKKENKYSNGVWWESLLIE